MSSSWGLGLGLGRQLLDNERACNTLTELVLPEFRFPSYRPRLHRIFSYSTPSAAGTNTDRPLAPFFHSPPSTANMAPVSFMLKALAITAIAATSVVAQTQLPACGVSGPSRAANRIEMAD